MISSFIYFILSFFINNKAPFLAVSTDTLLNPITEMDLIKSIVACLCKLYGYNVSVTVVFGDFAAFFFVTNFPVLADRLIFVGMVSVLY